MPRFPLAPIPKIRYHLSNTEPMRPPFKLKRHILAFAILGSLSVALALFWPKPPRQIITMPNGSTYEFGGASFGTNAVIGSPLARFARHLPDPLWKFAQKFPLTESQKAYTSQEPGPQFWVWLNQLHSNNTPMPLDLGAWLTDEDNVDRGWVCLLNVDRQWAVAFFPLVPRRSRTLHLVIYQGNTNHTIDVIGSVSFPNPLYGRFPQWEPEPVPSVKKADSLQVRLNRVAAVTNQLRSGTNNEILITGTDFDFSILSPTNSEERWTLCGSELSDATGNQWRNYGTNPLTAAFWPGESAWRLKLDFKRLRGFSTDEIATFKDVSLPATGNAFTPITNFINGTPVVLAEVTRTKVNLWQDMASLRQDMIGIESPAGDWGSFQVKLPGQPPETFIDILDVAIDPKISKQPGGYGLTNSSPWMSFASTGLEIPTNAKTAAVTVVIQKTRSVEFLIKPPTP